MGYYYCSWCPKRMRWEDIIVEDTVYFEYKKFKRELKKLKKRNETTTGNFLPSG